MALLFVLCAVIFEVVATAALRAGVDDSVWYIAATIGYVISYVFLGLALRMGMVIGVAYAIWGAVGIVATALVGTVLFNEFLSVAQMVGMGLIIVGVVLVETGSGAKGSKAEPEAQDSRAPGTGEAPDTTGTRGNGGTRGAGGTPRAGGTPTAGGLHGQPEAGR